LFRQAKIQDFDPPIARDEEVFRLQVAVDDSFLVRRRQPVRNLLRALDGATGRQSSACQFLAQRRAFQQFGGDVVRRTFSADVKNGENVGMVERPGSAANASGRTLSATSRPSRASRARNTSPMPPAPSGATIS
jgi:hypothetical protein